MSKKLQQKQARRQAEARRKAELRRATRRRNLLTIGIAVIVVIAVGALVYADRQAKNAPVGVSADEADCSDVEEFEATGRTHIPQAAQHEPYNSSPPTNGPHYEQPAQTGFYTSPLQPEQLVHNLEHGQIVIWYSPDAPDDVKSGIEAIVNKQRLATVASPYEGELDGNFALTAWLGPTKQEGKKDPGTGVLQTCEQVSQDVVNDFRRNYQGKSPEPATPRFTG